MSQQQHGEMVPAALKQQSGAREEGWPAGIRLRYRELIWERFQQQYRRLLSLPRRTRRRLQRKLAMSLAALALMLALSGAPTVYSMPPLAGQAPFALLSSTVSGDFQPGQGRQVDRWGPGETPLRDRAERARQSSTAAPVLPGAPAAIIVVDGNDPLTDCTLPDAIVAANTDTATGNCAAGTGADIIDIQVDVNLTAPAPWILSEMTLEGNDHTIAGDNTFGPVLEVDFSGDMTLNDATVSNGRNTGYGGGVYIFGGSAEINDSTFTNNHAGSGGGGLANVYGSSVIINNSQFVHNHARQGGAIYSFYFTPVTISRSSIISNTASIRGGGISNYIFSSMVITDSTISGNYSEDRAGGVYNYWSNMVVENSTIANNGATRFGAGFLNTVGGTAVINNSTISGNMNTGTRGGGVFSGRSTNLTINDSTITGNTAAGPGAGLLLQGGQTELNRSLVSGNANTSTGSAGEVRNSAVLIADNYNLFGHDGLTTAQAIGGFVAGATDILATSDGALPTPLSAILDTTLADNGGPTQTHALPDMSSPAVNGALLGCAAGMLDQRGYPRGMGPGMGGALCDIGAFELQDAPPAELSLSGVGAGSDNGGPTNVSLSGFGGGSDSSGFLAGVATAIMATAMAALAAAGVALRRRRRLR